MFRLDHERPSKSDSGKIKRQTDIALMISFVIGIVATALGTWQQLRESEEAQRTMDLLRRAEQSSREHREMQRATPSVPLVSITTHSGLPLPLPSGNTITDKEHDRYRYHTLEVRNTNTINLNSVAIELLLPERIVSFVDTQSTAGVRASLKSQANRDLVGAANGGLIEYMPGPSLMGSRHYMLDVDVLPANGFINVSYLTERDPRVRPFPTGITHHIGLQGEYRYVSDNRVSTKKFDCELQFDWTNRVTLSGPAVQTDKQWFYRETQ